MRRRNELIFDEVITASSAAPVYTSDKHSAMLGEFDQLAIHVVVDKVTTAATSFQLFIEHSADGRTWIQKNAAASSGDVQIASLSTTTTNSAWGSDPGSIQNPPLPSLGHVRFKMIFGAANTAHVKVHVTQRDQGG